LVVDASGRGSSASKWLTEAEIAQPLVTEVGIDIRYTAVDVERRPGDVDGSAFVVVQNDRHLGRIGVALPAEGDRWKIVLGGYFGDGAEPTRDGMLTFARSLPDPAIAELLENPWVSEPARYRFPSSRHTHWEKLGGLPEGFVAVGDSVASFNPIYGQGMSSAALQAEALGRCLERPGHHFARTAAKALAAVVSHPWQVAAGADFIYP